MLKQKLVVFLCSSLMCFSLNSWAEPITVGKGDSVEQVLKAHIVKRVSIKTSSGAELGGKVVSVNGLLTHLGGLTGKEFYDAVIVNKKIEAVIIRTK